MDRILRPLTWIAAIFIAGILLWYEQYKLTGNPGSVWLFTTLSDWLHIHGYYFATLPPAAIQPRTLSPHAPKK